MESQQKTTRTARIDREIPEKELNEIMRGVGDKARAQTIEQKARLTNDLRKELAAVRASFQGHDHQKPEA